MCAVIPFIHMYLVQCTEYSVCVCVCVCVVMPFILDVRLVDAPAGVTQDSSTFLLRCCLSREGFSRPFPSSTVKSNFVCLRINRSPLVGYDFYLFFYFLFFCEEKSQFVRPTLMGTKNLYENGPNLFFYSGPKIWSESNLWQRFCFGMVSTGLGAF